MVECFRWETGGRSTRWDRFQMETRSVHRVHPPCRGAYLGAAAAEAPAQRVGSRTSCPGMPPQELRAARSASTEEARAITGLSPPTAFRARCRSRLARRPALRRGACGCSPAEAGRHVHLEIGLSLRRDFSRSGRRLGRGRLELRLPRPCVVGRNKGRLWRGVEGGGESRSSRACSFASWPWRESTSRLKSAAAAQRRPPRASPPQPGRREIVRRMDGATLGSTSTVALGWPEAQAPPPAPPPPAITPLSRPTATPIPRLAHHTCARSFAT